MELTAHNYHEAALDRLEDARKLRQEQRWAGCVYLAGRAVEALFRALVRRRTPELDTGHDLRALLRKARYLGIVGAAENDRLGEPVNELAAVWNNDLRFSGSGRLLEHLHAIGRTRRTAGRPVLGDPLKANALAVLEYAEQIVNRGNLLWRLLTS